MPRRVDQPVVCASAGVDAALGFGGTCGATVEGTLVGTGGAGGVLEVGGGWLVDGADGGDDVEVCVDGVGVGVSVGGALAELELELELELDGADDLLDVDLLDGAGAGTRLAGARTPGIPPPSSDALGIFVAG